MKKIAIDNDVISLFNGGTYGIKTSMQQCCNTGIPPAGTFVDMSSPGSKEMCVDEGRRVYASREE